MGGAKGEAFCPSSSIQIRSPQHLIRVSHQLPTWVLILPILQTRKLTPSRLFILSHTDTKRQRWVFLLPRALPTAPQQSPGWAIGSHSIWLRPAVCLGLLRCLPPSLILRSSQKAARSWHGGNIAADVTFTLTAQKILQGMSVCVRDGEKGREAARMKKRNQTQGARRRC